MANEKVTALPTVVNATLADIIYAVQGGTSVQETLQQVINLGLSQTILSFAGNPNGNVAGNTFQLCWDTVGHILYICTTSGTTVTAVWTSAGSVSIPVTLAQGGTSASLIANDGGIFYSTATAGAILAGTPTAGKVLQSGATAAPSWSTPTYPSASGTAGKVLASDGTNIVYSTPTFPNASATAGKVIISDGTNWIASTSIFPNTVGAAGKILRSDGTSNAYSTSTFADTYAASTLLYSNGANTVTGLATANSAVLRTDSTGVPAWSASMTNGQVQIGSTGATPVLSTLTAGIGIDITNGAGSITIASSGFAGTSVYAASAGSLGTVTQSGAGVGATLTNAGAQAVFALDGVNPPVGTNVLIKNTATGMAAQNEGIYTVTNVGSGATNWVLTRATGFDTPSEINDTGLIVIQNGSTLAGQAWYNTTTIVTVDTTAFNFVRFGTQNNFNAVVMQVFTSSGTYTPTTGMKYCIIECVGGGGGGGGGAGVAATSCGAGGGGGGGAYGRSVKTAAQVGASQVVTIGAGGAGGASGNNNGINGGITSVGALVTANGGTEGEGSAAKATIDFGGRGGPGGTAGTADLAVPGQNGGIGFVLAPTGGVAIPGNGGSTIYGGGGVFPSGTSAAGTNYGSGGSGGAALGANAAGGNGKDGLVVITEFISA